MKKSNYDDLKGKTEEELCQKLVEALEGWANDLKTIKVFKFGTRDCDECLIDFRIYIA